MVNLWVPLWAVVVNQGLAVVKTFVLYFVLASAFSPERPDPLHRLWKGAGQCVERPPALGETRSPSQLNAGPLLL